MSKRHRIVAITGNRNCHDQAVVTEMMAQHLQKDDEVWVGGASGVESLARLQAEAWGMKLEVVLAHWKEEGETNPKASIERYLNMAENCHVILALIDGSDTAPLNLIHAGIERGREVHCYPWKKK